MKVLFLPRYPYQGASSRYRVYQYLPALEQQGIKATTSPFMSEALYQLSLKPNNTIKKIILTLFATIKRLAILIFYKQYDIIYLQRELFPFGPPIIERLLKKLGCTIVFDYDDALFIHKDSGNSKLASHLRQADKTFELFIIANQVFAGNNYLRDIALKTGADAITFEVAEDTQRIKKRPSQNNEQDIIIGWLGSPSTAKYLKLIQKPLQNILDKYPNVKLHIMGASENFILENIIFTPLTWSLNNEIKALQSFSIGLMPLPEEDWSKGKCGGKARTYMAAGIVPICSNIGYNQTLIKNKETGLLCNTLKEWEQQLILAIENPDLREKISINAREYVEENFDLKEQSIKMASLLHDLQVSSQGKLDDDKH